MKTNPERKKAVKDCDKWFSLYIRGRDHQKCWCGQYKDEPMQCNHLFSRTSYSTRWNANYAFCGHSGCNLRHEHHAEIMIDWFQKAHGMSMWEQGMILNKSTLKLTTGEIWLQAKVFKDKYESLTKPETDYTITGLKVLK
jgi:hypothetical protein